MKMRKAWCMSSRMQKSGQTQKLQCLRQSTGLQTDRQRLSRSRLQCLHPCHVETVGLLLRSPQISGSNLVWVLAACLLCCLLREVPGHVGQSADFPWGSHHFFLCRAQDVSPVERSLQIWAQIVWVPTYLSGKRTAEPAPCPYYLSCTSPLLPPAPWGALCLGSLLVVLGVHYLKPHYPWASPCLASGWGWQGWLPPHSHILSLQSRVGVGKQGGRWREHSYQLVREGSALLSSIYPRCYRLSPDRVHDEGLFSCVTSHSVA